MDYSAAVNRFRETREAMPEEYKTSRALLETLIEDGNSGEMDTASLIAAVIGAVFNLEKRVIALELRDSE